MLLTRRPTCSPTAELLRRRDREVWTANHWAAAQPLSARSATMAALEEWAGRINDQLAGPSQVLRVGLTLQPRRALRPR